MRLLPLHKTSAVKKKHFLKLRHHREREKKEWREKKNQILGSSVGISVGIEVGLFVGELLGEVLGRKLGDLAQIIEYKNLTLLLRPQEKTIFLIGVYLINSVSNFLGDCCNKDLS